ncbi:hypothetical protein CVU83_01305 [Candidatus Falkowbacteria bacterium HGW-Falkowbacteria-2]|uniref:Uncharacterized protein n=1 Tax=Candidatus Falkowbacteria bacterium HGW-Falkowbacteria-2 TaxID=2013769 RepID=A0A2N2E1N7_9BACT|nr:MAG: hypothetical protein CVU83_01305 [Candidatus Falkowbacteria bacterium HGW-Falkowbacteria-2]
MSLQRKIFHNTLIQIAGKVASTGLNLFAFALMTRELGQAGFGEYTTAITFLSFFAIIADLGLTLVTAQMISSEPEKEEKILGNLFGLRLVSALVFIGLAPIIVLFFDYSSGIKMGVLLAAASFIFTALNQIMVGLFQNRLKMDRVAWAETLSRFVLITGVILSVVFDWGLAGILITTSAASLASFLLHFYFARQFARISPLFESAWWRKIITLSWPLAITIAFNLIYLRADTLILSLIKGQEEVGLYGAAYKIIDVLSSLPFMFAGIILPLLVTAWQLRDNERFSKVLQKSFDAMAIAALPVVVGAQFLADEIIVLIAGPEFIEAGAILRVLILAVAAIFLGNMAAHAIIAVKAQKKVIGIYVFTGITSLIAYLYLIPRYSYFGAAAVTVYSESAIAVLTGIFLYRHLKLSLKLTGLVKAVIASAIMGAMLWFWPSAYASTILGLLATLTLAAIVYVVSLFILRAFTKSDLELIMKQK